MSDGFGFLVRLAIGGVVILGVALVCSAIAGLFGMAGGVLPLPVYLLIGGGMGYLFGPWVVEGGK